MGFASTVVTNDQYSLVILRLLKLDLRKNKIDQLVSHAIRNHVRIDKFTCRLFLIGIPQLNDGLDWLKLDEITIAHRSLPLCLLLPDSSKSGNACVQALHRIKRHCYNYQAKERSILCDD